MSMIKDFLGIAPFKHIFGSTTDDWVDKLNHGFTTTILVVFAFIVSTAQFVSDPIHCWAPAEFPEFYIAYTKSYCWIKNTYFVPMTDEIPVNVGLREEEEITYYQWVPLIILFMAFLFKCPYFIWKMTNQNTGFCFKEAARLTDRAYAGNKEEYQEAIDTLARLIDTWIRSHHYYQRLNVINTIKAKLSRVVCMYCNKKEGKYLSALYFNVKLLYVINVIGQFYLLNDFLGMDFNSLGYKVLNGLYNEQNWPESPRFPRITLCDFRIRQLQNVQRFTVQCVLPINLFNEKIFIFLWFWLFLIAVVSTVNLFKWFVILIARKNNKRFLKKYLKITHQMKDEHDKKMHHRFSNYYLRDDGCFILRIIGMNTSDLVVIDVVEELWLRYLADSSKGRRPRTLEGAAPSGGNGEKREDTTPLLLAGEKNTREENKDK